MPSIFDWSSTAASNGTVDGVNIAEGCPAGNMNNAVRSVMAILKQTFTSTLQTFWAGSSALPIANGGTAGATAADARTNLGLGAMAVLNIAPIANGGSGAATQAAAFANLSVVASSLGTPGYIKFPNGLTYQWGFVTSSGTPGGQVSTPYSVIFPTATLSLQITPNNNSATTTAAWADSVDAGGFNLRCSAASVGCYWFAVGI